MRIPGLTREDYANWPAADNGIYESVISQIRLTMAEGQIIGATEVKHLVNIKGTGEIVQVLIAQGVETRRAVSRAAVAAAAVEAGSSASLDIVLQRMRPGEIGVKLHAVIQPLPEFRLQRVVIGIPLVGHFNDALSRSERIHLEKVDGIGSSGRRANRVASAETRDQ